MQKSLGILDNLQQQKALHPNPPPPLPTVLFQHLVGRADP
jgi:hypothetical protein